VKEALLVVDVQRDFCEGGALAAFDTSSFLKPLQVCIDAARRARRTIVFTQDWHPSNHISFRARGGSWPVHCVAGTTGAELMPLLSVQLEDIVVQKGTERNLPGYSAFECTDLANTLRRTGIVSVAICGIAAECCVLASALDAVAAGFRVVVLLNLIRPIRPFAAGPVLRELRHGGVELIHADSWLRGPP